jgi:hypothetical protein
MLSVKTNALPEVATLRILPEGFQYQPELIGLADEKALLSHVRELFFFSARHLQKADDIPDYLLELRMVAAAFAGLESDEFQHVLVTEYGPGAGIGWHRDKAVFGEVVGISLLPCVCSA